jgi:hypothetical protein
VRERAREREDSGGREGERRGEALCLSLSLSLRALLRQEGVLLRQGTCFGGGCDSVECGGSAHRPHLYGAVPLLGDCILVLLHTGKVWGARRARWSRD